MHCAANITVSPHTIQYKIHIAAKINTYTPVRTAHLLVRDKNAVNYRVLCISIKLVVFVGENAYYFIRSSALVAATHVMCRYIDCKAKKIGAVASAY